MYQMRQSVIMFCSKTFSGENFIQNSYFWSCPMFSGQMFSTKSLLRPFGTHKRTINTIISYHQTWPFPTNHIMLIHQILSHLFRPRNKHHSQSVLNVSLLFHKTALINMSYYKLNTNLFSWFALKINLKFFHFSIHSIRRTCNAQIGLKYLFKFSNCEKNGKINK
jgi:hypothetical protein